MQAIATSIDTNGCSSVLPPSAPSERSVVWVEIPSANLERSIAFFELVLGVDLERQSMFGVEVALLPAAEGQASASIYQSSVSVESTGAVVHLAVEKPLARALDRVSSGGGEVLSDLIAVPDGGRFAYCATPEGFRFGLYSEG